MATKRKNPEVKAQSSLDAFRTYSQQKLKVKLSDLSLTITEEELLQSSAHIPTNVLAADYCIGGAPDNNGVAPCPGIPRGHITMISGKKSAGKTTLCMHVAASVQKSGGSVLWIDTEQRFSFRWAANLGVRCVTKAGELHPQFQYMRPDNLEIAISWIEMAIRTGVDLIVLDSIDFITKNDESAEDLANGKNIPALVARAWHKGGKLLRVALGQKLKALDGDFNQMPAVIGISQERANINGGPWAPKHIVTGGSFWEHAPSLHLSLRPRKIKEEIVDELTGVKQKVQTSTQVTMTVIKTSISNSTGKCISYILDSEDGCSNVETIAGIALNHGVVSKSGSWMRIPLSLLPEGKEWPESKSAPGCFQFQGYETLIKMLKANESMQRSLFKASMDKMGRLRNADADNSSVGVDPGDNG
jgi:recombination protein RecA